MKMKHHVPVKHLRLTDPVTPEYQAEVDRTMARADARYRKALADQERDERRLARLVGEKKGKGTSKRQRAREVDVLRERIEMRRQDLLDLHRTMNQSDRSAQHRGTDKPHRNIPSSEVF